MKTNKILRLFRYQGIISIIYYIAFLALIWYLIIPHTSIYYRNNIFSPFWQRLNKEDVTLVQGETIKLYVMEINKKVYFSSTDIKVADVNIFGKVVAYRNGTTIIKAKVDGKVLKCRVRVIDMNKDKLNLKVGKSSRLKVKGAWFGIRWKSNDTSIAIVNRFGKVTAVAKGNAVVTGNVRGKKVTCNIKVK